ncbi:hypothetical protein Hanom_Chr04g00317421 [Helianthus anomalus]
MTEPNPICSLSYVQILAQKKNNFYQVLFSITTSTTIVSTESRVQPTSVQVCFIVFVKLDNMHFALIVVFWEIIILNIRRFMIYVVRDVVVVFGLAVVAMKISFCMYTSASVLAMKISLFLHIMFSSIIK